MGFNKLSYKSYCKKRVHFLITLILLALLTTQTVLCKSPSLSASIPTHHGINLDSLHLNERGGAVVTRRRANKYLYPTSHTTLPHTDETEGAPSTTSVSQYTLKPVVQNVVNKPSKDTSISTSSNQQIKQQQESGLSKTAITSMSLLALQFGIQPILVRKYTPQTIVRSSVVLVQELVKFVIAGTIYFTGTTKETREKDYNDWSIKTWIALAGIPAFLYTIQNIAALMAYQNLEALTFNVLNQTKILSAALSCYFILGKRQSSMQVFSLCILIGSTLVIEQILNPTAIKSLLSGSAFKSMSGSFSLSGASRRVTHGVIPLLLASFISGIAGACCQRCTQGGTSKVWGKKGRSTKATVTRSPRDVYLFSIELGAASVILLLANLVMSSSGREIIRSGSFFSNWTPETFIPVLTNSIGGILVGLVTKHAGSVRKGFALIFGLLISGIFQAMLGGSGIRAHQIVGGLLAATSLWMHTTNPYKPPLVSKKAVKE